MHNYEQSNCSGVSEPTGITDSFISNPNSTNSCPADASKGQNSRRVRQHRTSNADNSPKCDPQPSSGSAFTNDGDVPVAAADTCTATEKADSLPSDMQKDAPSSAPRHSTDQGEVPASASLPSQPNANSAPQVSDSELAGGSLPTTTAHPTAGHISTDTPNVEQKLETGKPSDNDWSQFAADWDDHFFIPLDLPHRTGGSLPGNTMSENQSGASNHSGQLPSVSCNRPQSMGQYGMQNLSTDGILPSQQFQDSRFRPGMNSGWSGQANRSFFTNQMPGQGLQSTLVNS